MKDLDWKNLGFKYTPAKSNIRYTYTDGQWSTGTLHADASITMSIAATCLHYGQAAFEGIKAFACKDGEIRVFRPEMNAARMARTSDYILGPEVPEDLFLEAIKRVIDDNREFVPPYGTNGSLYIRPLLIGTGPQIGVAPADEYEFIIMVMPVGEYYKGGIKPVDAIVTEDYDRAAPLGTGSYKVAGNYAASLTPAKKAKDMGFPIVLYFDAKTHEYVEEFGTSNFFAITKDGKFVTPESPSILGSVTNLSLQQIAKDLGLVVERRPIHKSELADFVEVGACGTAVVVTPISSITLGETVYSYGKECGPVCRKLYEHMTAIQYGEVEDTHGWLMTV